jgi:lipopolysaccharide export system protein LptA
MAASSPDYHRRQALPSRTRTPAGVLAVVLTAVLTAVLAVAAAPASAQVQQEITLEATSSDFDRRNERLVFREVRVQQGDTVISADQAESRDLDFSRGSWTFTGNVRISSPAGDIQAARATVAFTDHQLARATADGAPARFSRTMPPPEARTVRGTANRIVYDLAAGELELAGQASLRDGVREVSGGRLVYRIAEDRLIASAEEDGSDRVRIVITPPGQNDPGEAEPDGGDGQ